MSQPYTGCCHRNQEPFPRISLPRIRRPTYTSCRRPDDQLSDLNGIYMRTYRKGNAPLREKVEIRLRRTKQ